jgi:hypothetical protein
VPSVDKKEPLENDTRVLGRLQNYSGNKIHKKLDKISRFMIK